MSKTPMYNLFDNYILPILTITEYDWLLLTFKILALLIALYIILKAFNGYRLSSFRTITHLLWLITYAYFRYQACVTNVYIFKPNNNEVGYIDIIFILIAISLLSPWFVIILNFIWNLLVKGFRLIVRFIKRNPIQQKEKIPFTPIPDIPLTNPDKDKLGYAKFAENVAIQIDSIRKEDSSSLGIIAEWGVGKSTVINFIEHYLDKKKYIIIRFNPRHSINPERIQVDYYNLITSGLKKYNSIFSTIFVDYMKSAGIIGKNNTIQVILNLYNVWKQDGEKSRINDAIKKLNKRKRVIVIIEDLDRLFAEEIIEVFKIIDIDISKYFIFISAYDKEHINGILDFKYETQNSKFSDKFFNWEVHVPLIPYDKIIDFLIANFSDYFEDKPLQENYDRITDIFVSIIDENRKIIEPAFSNNIDLIKSYIKTMRDAKRFLNTFIELVHRKKGHIVIEDLLLITLIQYKYPTEHSELFNHKYIDIDLIEDRNKYILKNNIENEPKCIEVLKILFKKERPKKIYTINNKEEFLDYFYYYPESINSRNLSTLLEIDINESISYVEKWINERKKIQLFDFFDNLDILKLADIKSIYNYIEILLYIQTKHNHDIRFYIRPFFLKAESTEICKKYSIKPKEFKTEFSSKLKGQPGKYPSNLIRELIINTIDEGEEDYLFTKAELQDIAKFHIKNYINKKVDITENLEIELLYENIDTLEMPDRIIKLNKEVCELIKDYIIERPDFYIQSFVRNGMFSSSKDWFMLACEPFWEQIFVSNTEFEKFIMNSLLVEKDKIKLVRNFWTIYRLNNYKPIQFENQRITYEEAIADDLQSIAEEALKFEQYEATVDEISNEEISNEDKINKLKEISAKIESTNLYIRKRGEVDEIIRRYIAELSTPQEVPEISEE